MIYFLRLVELLFIFKCIWNFLTPFALAWRAYRGKESLTESMFLVLDFLLLLIIMIFNVIVHFAYDEIGFFDQYAFFMCLLILPLSYSGFYIFSPVLHALIKVKK